MSLYCIEVFRVEVMLDIIRIVHTSTLPVIERKSFVNYSSELLLTRATMSCRCRGQIEDPYY